MSKRKLSFRVSRALAVGGLVASSSVLAISCSSNPVPDLPRDAGQDAEEDVYVTVNPAPDFGRDEGTPDAGSDADAAADASKDADAAVDASTDAGSDADAAD